MKPFLKKQISVFICFCCIISGLSGCSILEKNTKKELKILTELSLRGKVEAAASYMMQKDRQLSVEIEYISAEEESRKNQTEKLRTQIVAGEGADVYILNSVADKVNDVGISLFKNPYKTMQSGVFADLNPFIEKDTYWETGTYKKELLQAGQYDDGQYIIPLSCNYEVLVSSSDTLDYLKDLNLQEWLTEAKKTENLSLKKLMLARDLDAGKWMKIPADYEEGIVLFNQEQWTQFFLDQLHFKKEQFRQIGEASEGSIQTILPDTTSAIVVPDLTGKKLASVQAFGAVGMSSKLKEEAYQFLMLFLNEEVKTEQEKNGSGSILNGIIDESFPVQERAFADFHPELGLSESAKQCIVEAFRELEGSYFITETERSLTPAVFDACQKFDDPNADFSQWEAQAAKLAEQAYRQYSMQVAE